MKYKPSLHFYNEFKSSLTKIDTIFSQKYGIQHNFEVYNILENNKELISLIYQSIKNADDKVFHKFGFNKKELSVIFPTAYIYSIIASKFNEQTKNIHNSDDIDDTYDRRYIIRSKLGWSLQNMICNLFTIEDKKTYAIDRIVYEIIDILIKDSVVRYSKCVQHLTKRNIYIDISDIKFVYNTLVVNTVPVSYLCDDKFMISGHWCTLVKLFNKKSNVEYEFTECPLTLRGLKRITSEKIYLDKEILFDGITRRAKQLNVKLENLWSTILNEERELKTRYDTGTLLVYIKESQKSLAHYYELWWLYQLYINYILENKPLYFCSSYCFRGRLYNLTQLSVTSHKLLRYSIYLDEYTDDYSKLIEEWLNKSDSNAKLFNLVPDYVKDYFKKYDKTRQTRAYWTLITLGFKIIKKDSVTITEVIAKGFEYYINNNPIETQKSYDNDDIDKYFTKKICVKIIKDMENGININYLISKDATASGLQMLSLLCGVKEEHLKDKFNLKYDESYYDSYTRIIDLFWMKYSYKYKKNLMLWQRKNLKKFIMTIFYSGKFREIKEYVEEEYGEKISNEDLKVLEAFYNYIGIGMKENEESIIFETSIYDVLKKLFSKNDKLDYKNLETLKYLNTELNLTYYKNCIKKTQVEVSKKDESSKDHRQTFVSIKYVYKEVDLIKTKNSIIPNLIHFCDSTMIKFPMRSEEYRFYLTIHDCILTTPELIPLIMDDINRGFTQIILLVDPNSKIRCDSILSLI